MSANFDYDDQPNFWVNARLRRDRALNEMLGLVKGVIVDGEVSVAEANFLANWIRANPDAIDTWPGKAMAERLIRIFDDGIISDEERADLLYFLQQLVGANPVPAADVNAATKLPLDFPPPAISFAGHEFVFTGKFVWGTRSACESAISARGGTLGKSITRRTNFLVLGDLGSRDWVHTSFGRKIEKAVEYREAGVPIKIIDEPHWCSHL